MSLDEKKDELNNHTIERIQFWIANVDAKASFLLSFLGVVLGFILSSDSIAKLVSGYIERLYFDFSFKEIKIWATVINSMLLTASILLICLAIFRLLNVLRARLKPKHLHIDMESKSLMYWGSISKKNYRAFSRQLESATENSIRKDLRSQVYINSVITAEKFNQYNRATTLVYYGVSLFVLFKILSYFPLFN